MKIFGDSAKGKHNQNYNKNAGRREAGSHLTAEKTGGKKVLTWILWIVGGLAVAGGVAAIVVTLLLNSNAWVPDVVTGKHNTNNPATSSGTASGGSAEPGGAVAPSTGGGTSGGSGSSQTEPGGSGSTDTSGDSTGGSVTDTRTGEKYTFAILGMDKEKINTDTIMVATFDADDYTMDIVSIPRDTLVNVAWKEKRINTCYSMGPKYGMKSVDSVMAALGDLLGYDLDHYVMVDLTAFEVLVNELDKELGGIWFDVPEDMNYDDPYQDLHIHVQKGYQQVNGETALGIVRFRSYKNGTADIGRINTQQKFLKAIATQTLKNIGKLSISTMADLFINYVKTDLSLGNITWLAQHFSRMDSENIRFHTLPGDYGCIIYVGYNAESYIPVDVDDWLEMINAYLNPFDTPVAYENLDILTVDPATGRVYATSGVYAGDPGWGN